MKELLLYMAKNLVDDPEAVTVTEIEVSWSMIRWVISTSLRR